MGHEHYWQATATLPEPPALRGDEKASVCVIGGGITGVTAALLLRRAGHDVVLLEAASLGHGTTGHTSAHLTVLPDTGPLELERRVGEEGAAAMLEAGRRGIDRIVALDRELGGRGEVAHLPGFVWARDDQDLERIEQMAQSLRRHGVACTAPAVVPLPDERQGLRVPDQALFHPLRYLAQLAEAAIAEGVRIYTGSRVTGYGGGEVQTQQGRVEAERIVLATHTPVGLVPSVQLRVAPYASYVLIARLAEPLSPGLYYDLAEPYHYIRPLDGNRVLVGGADHKMGEGDPDDAIRVLEAWTRQTLPVEAIEQAWGHEFFEPADGMPYIGELPERPGVWVVSGMSGTGLTLGTFGAEAIVEALQTGTEPYFSPRRLKPAGSVDRVVKEGIDVLWRLVADRLRPTGELDLDDLEPGQGRIVTVQGRKIAVHRDDSGQLHVLSPVCRHMGCIVAWNARDRTWDCPCHGGRYDGDGTRAYGPPLQDLERREL